MSLIEKNPMLEKMKRGEPVLGCQVRSRSPLIAEMLGYCGLDYVFIEGEHFVHNIETVENQIRAIQVAGAVPIVRIPSHEDGLILQVIEAGQEKKEYTVTVTCGAGGSVSPSGNQKVAEGGSLSFTITPKDGYEVATLVIDGTTVLPLTSYSFMNVDSNHTLYVTFREK